MPIDFTQGGDTGENTSASIQPVSNTEPVVDTVTNRPTENLRKRTEKLKTESHTLEEHAIAASGAFISSDGGFIGIEQVDHTPLATTGIPASTGYKITPADDQKLIVHAPNYAGVDGGKAVIVKGDLTAFYAQASDNDLTMMRRGDSLALKFERTGSGSWKDKSWGTDLDYPGLAAGNITEAELVALPTRVVLTSPGANLITKYGPDGTEEAGLVSAGGIPQVDMWVTITNCNNQGATYWYDNGGRGGVDGSGNIDYLTVLWVTETTVVVPETTPFRILWDNDDPGIAWSLYKFDGVGGKELVTSGDSFTGATTTQYDYPNHHLVPICTFDGSGFVFTPNGGYVENSAIRRASFKVPANFLDLASDEDAHEGAASIGSKARTGSSAAADTYNVYTAAGTLSAQLDYLATAIARHDLTHVTEVTDTTVAAAGAVAGLAVDAFQRFGSNYATKDAKLTRIYVDITEVFTTSDGSQTALNFKIDTADAVYTPFAEVDLLEMPTGRFEVVGDQDFFDYAVDVQANKRLQLQFTAVGGAAELGNTTAGRLVAYVVTNENP